MKLKVCNWCDPYLRRGGIFPQNWTGMLGEATAIGHPAKDENARQLAAKAVIEETGHGHVGWPLPRTLVGNK